VHNYIKVRYYIFLIRDGLGPPGCGAGAGAPELGISPGARAAAQIKNQKEPEPELSSNVRNGAGAVVI